MLSTNPSHLWPTTAQAPRLISTRLQCCLSDLNTMGCSAWEASLSNILWSGGCSEWSSSARAVLHLCRSRAWSPASHMTCWFLSVCTRDCRILATASWRSSACWKRKSGGQLEKTQTEMANTRKPLCSIMKEKLSLAINRQNVLYL